MSQLKTVALAGFLMFCCFPLLADDQDIVSSEAVEDFSDDLESFSAFESSAVMSDEELNTHRAKEDIEIDQITINDQEQDGYVTDNVAENNTTGNNTITEGSFTNSSGFISTVQNTGNNVLIQHSTIINVAVETVP